MRTKRNSFLAAAILIFLLSLANISAAQDRADLSITNTAQPNPATVSTPTVPRNITYGMNVINNGPNRATGVQVSFTLPAPVTLVSARFNFIGGPSIDCASNTTTVSCNIGSVDSGNLAGAAVVVILRAQATGVLRAAATVKADQPDPDMSNNSAAVETIVEPQVSEPIMTDRNLVVSTVVSGLTTPTGIAFLDRNDFFVLEQLTGKVKRIVNGAVQSTVLDLGVNNFSERGLLGIALHPDFESNHFVYLYWTCRSNQRLGQCDGLTSSADTNPALVADSDKVPLRGNRVDRFIWNGTTLRFDKNIIQLHAFQEDANQTPRGNHNGGKILFGQDDKLYVYMGDNGRRGWMQNITTGFGPNGNDDQFGGPEPDNNHLTGFVLRLNDDGSTPEDNPFFEVEASDLPRDLRPRASAEVIANIHKLFAYGIRNGFGIAFDPMTGELWESQNGDDSGSEINHISAGFNGGWIQIMGRAHNIADFKAIETSPVYFGLQQLRWPPTLIADSPRQARHRLFMLPSATYTDPLLTWKYEVAPAGFGFIEGEGLGADFDGDLIIGGARDFLLQGHLFRFKLNEDRTDLDLSSDPEVNESRVIEDRNESRERRDSDDDGAGFIRNHDKWDITGSEKFLFGQGFGITTDIKTGPNGHLFVVSLTRGTVYEIRRQP
jgi:uncharacterized repeat protein (TIGR01451 family)